MSEASTSRITLDDLVATMRRLNRRPGRFVWSYRGTVESFQAAMETQGVKRLTVGPMDVRLLGALEYVQFDEWVLIGTTGDLREFLRHPHDLIRSVLRQKEIAPDLPAFVPQIGGLS